MKHAKSRGGGMTTSISGTSNKPETYQRWARTMHQRSKFLAKILAMAQLEKGNNGNALWYTIYAFFVFHINTFDVEDKEGIFCISSGLCVTLGLQEYLFKTEIHGK